MKRGWILALLATNAMAYGQYSYKVHEITPPPGANEAQGTGIYTDGRVILYAVFSNAIKPYVGPAGGPYTVLPVPNGNIIAYPYQSNSSGLIPGTVYVANPVGFQPVWWDSNLQLNTMGLPLGFTSAQTWSVNDRGQFLINGDSPTPRAFLWDSLSGYRVRNPLPGYDECQGESVLWDGTIVGTSNKRINGSGVQYVGTYWPPDGTPTALPPIQGQTQVRGLSGNSSGTIVGDVWQAHGALRWKNLAPEFLPGATGNNGVGRFVNEAGDAYGEINSQAVIWPNTGGVVNLNDMIDPQTPGWRLDAALRADAAGTILIYGDHNGRIGVNGTAVPYYGELLGVDLVTVNFGYIVQGDDYSLSAKDGDVLRIGRAFIPVISLPPVQVTVAGHTPYATLGNLALTCWSRVTVAGSFMQDIELFNFQTNTWDTTDVKHSPLTRSLGEAQLQATGNVARYRRADGVLRARYHVRSTGFVATQAWAADHDLVQWTVTP